MFDLNQFHDRPGLLVSVRDSVEAEAALRGKADVIDVKEPARGALGAADPRDVAAVVATVAGRTPVSFAAGELCDWSLAAWQTHLEAVGDRFAYTKFGLAGCRSKTGWRARWQQLVAMLPTSCQPVGVAYADWKTADAPRPEVVLEHARALGCAALLVDTYNKHRGTLLDHWPLSELREFAKRVRDERLVLVLAGSLSGEQLTLVAECRPALIAVRGAACDGDRRGQVSEQRVAAVRAAISTGRPAPTPAPLSA